jgi:hypothetical protein
MTTKNQMIQIIRAENPNGLKEGNDEQGYVDLTPAEYEERIAEWAENRLSKLAKIAEAEEAKTTAQAKLAALGLTADDLKALGL